MDFELFYADARIDSKEDVQLLLDDRGGSAASLRTRGHAYGVPNIETPSPSGTGRSSSPCSLLFSVYLENASD